MRDGTDQSVQNRVCCSASRGNWENDAGWSVYETGDEQLWCSEPFSVGFGPKKPARHS